MNQPLRISVLGAGVWGRAVGTLAARRGHIVSLLHHTASGWGDIAEQLPTGESQADTDTCESDYSSEGAAARLAMAGEQSSGPGPGGHVRRTMDYLLLALPVQHIRETLRHLPAPGAPVLGLSKGLEVRTGMRVSEVITQIWGERRVGALSGPTFATEIQRGMPAACVVAAEDETLAEAFQDLLHQPSFRTYRSTDLKGVELGGALKNVYAIACGVCAGLDLGESCQAALFTRCLAEMTRLGVNSGARAETFAGLSGVGDLHLTGMSQQSRNHRVGRLLATVTADAGSESKGETSPKDSTALTSETYLPALQKVLAQLGGVAEGVPTTKSAYLNPLIPADSKPIVTEVYRLLYEGKDPRKAVRDLLGRSMKKEVY
ncbi:MAG: NAD(P)H-dependent glycerol-3-phosphate dehydrogenase [Candidatus Methylacidiphilales bacterium]|nr:NAD(P)H-dependent glycerol-3-phosphate dehydrogenase [Candidatus Methylacidiphilales bacterium]